MQPILILSMERVKVLNGNCYTSLSDLVNNLNTFTTNCSGDFFEQRRGGASFNIFYEMVQRGSDLN